MKTRMFVVCAGFWILCVALGAGAKGCDDAQDNCEPTSTRCVGSAVEVCNGNGEWSSWIDCDSVSLKGKKGAYKCVEKFPGEYACVKRKVESK